MGKLYLVHINHLTISLVQYDIAKTTKSRYYVGNEYILIGDRHPYVSFLHKDHRLIFTDLRKALAHYQSEAVSVRTRLSNLESVLYRGHQEAARMLKKMSQ